MGVNLTINCYVPPSLDLVMSSKSSQHEVSVEVDCMSLLGTESQKLIFYMDFVYENIGLGLKTTQFMYAPQSDLVLE